ncbi:hypothetical protein RRG08_024591 [Elysia crispata]|uniref:Uncharacterized protein n=1 Tax=Elysia crispata TaxID=231223 RepID=A0AAE0ZW87_9GAST|nr:hypothetical protein RRG08_024591 [Elysia crispata]
MPRAADLATQSVDVTSTSTRKVILPAFIPPACEENRFGYLIVRLPIPTMPTDDRRQPVWSPRTKPALEPLPPPPPPPPPQSPKNNMNDAELSWPDALTMITLPSTGTVLLKPRQAFAGRYTFHDFINGRALDPLTFA